MGFGGFLRKDTAVDVLIGPFVSSSDGDTEMTALTISQGDVLLSKNGQALAQKSDNTAAAHDADGYYNCELDATDTNTAGQLTITIHEATSLAVRHDYQIVEEVIYDALYAASANAWSGAAGSTTLTALASGSITAAVIATGAIDADAIADNAIDAGAIAADAITASKIAAGAIDAATFAADVDAEILSYIVDDATRIDASALNTASVTSIPAILVDTGTTLDGKIDTIDNNVDSILADTGTDGVVVAAASKTGYTLSAAGLADFFDTDTGETAGDAVAGSVVAEIGELAASGGLTVQDIVDGVWDEPIASHLDSGSTGEALDDAGGAGTPPTVGEIADEVQTRTIAAVTVVNGLGANVITAAATAADFGTEVGTAVWATAARTLTAFDEDNLTLDINGAIETAVGTALATYDPPTRAELTSDTNSVLTAVGDVPTNAELATALGTADDAVLAAIAALNNLSAAQVNAEVVDALNTDTYAEPGQGTPAATAALTAKIGYLYKAWRNRTTQTASEYALYGDDAVTKDQEAAISDDGTTLVKGEVATGA